MKPNGLRGFPSCKPPPPSQLPPHITRGATFTRQPLNFNRRYFPSKTKISSSLTITTTTTGRRHVLLAPLIAVGASFILSSSSKADETNTESPPPPPPPSPPPPPPEAVQPPPAAEISSRIYDATVIGEPMAVGKEKSKVWEKIMNARIVYLGEAEQVPTKDDKVLELEIVSNLMKRCVESEKSVSLALEAFPSYLQPHLDQFLHQR